MDSFQLRGGIMHCEDVPLPELAATLGTPLYVYSAAAMNRQVETFRAAIGRLGDPLIAYAVKANPNAAVIATFAGQGLGADVVSGGEYRRARAAGVPADRIVFSGVGKTREEMALALQGGLFQFNLESVEEALMLSDVATSLGLVAPVAFRINPDVEAGSHAKISTGSATNKFGVSIADAPAAYRTARSLPGLELRGVAVHIGSQLTSLAPLETAFAKIGDLIARLRSDGFEIQVADLGGGLGISYDPDLPPPPSPQAYGRMIERVSSGWNLRLVFEPGRLLVGSAGVLLTRVIRIKPGAGAPFVVVDAAMNDLMRPALYDAWHKIEAVAPGGPREKVNVVGPVCETGDTFAMDRDMDRVEAGDLLLFRTAGAYAATMASTYNSRPLAAEVMVKDGSWELVRDRLDVEKLIEGERIPSWLPRPS